MTELFKEDHNSRLFMFHQRVLDNMAWNNIFETNLDAEI